jgi:hypothetical protein
MRECEELDGVAERNLLANPMPRRRSQVVLAVAGFGFDLPS